MLEKWREQVKQLKRETFALYLAYRHPDTPILAKVWTVLVVAYAFSPIDLIPDFIPVLGYLDDLILVPLGIAIAIKLIPPNILRECREQAAQSEQDRSIGKPAAFVIVTLWILGGVIVAWWVSRIFTP